MTDAPKPPKRRSRKLIVAFVVLVSLVSWWFWPRGDARFVGTWEYRHETGGVRLDRLCLRSNGTGFTIPKSATTSSFGFSWRVNGENFTIGRARANRSTRMDSFDRINAVVSKITGRGVLDTEWHYRILSAAQGVIRIQEIDSSQSYDLVRIPE